jgi:hypothetical protein
MDGWRHVGSGVWWHPLYGHAAYCHLCAAWYPIEGVEVGGLGDVLHKAISAIVQTRQAQAQQRTKALDTLRRIQNSPGWCAPPTGPMTEKDIQQMASCASDYWNSQMTLGPTFFDAKD